MAKKLNDMISRCIFFDIETLESDRETVLGYLATLVDAPGNYKRPESREKWLLEEGPAAFAESVAKTALEGGFGRLASVAFAVGNGDVLSATSAKPATDDAPAGYDAATERKVISRIFAACERVYYEVGEIPTLVGHNVIGFDIRWLWKRAIVLGIKPPSWWPIDAKPWQTDRVFDTMTQWEGHGGRISQDRLCLALDLPMKTDFDGSAVGAAWKAGEFEKIRTYNAGDVSTVRSIWKRITLYADPVVEESALPPLLAPEPIPAPSMGFRPAARTVVAGAAA